MIFYKISRYQYQYFKSNKYVNLIQAQEQDLNIEQGSMLYRNSKNVSVNLINQRLHCCKCRQITTPKILLLLYFG